MIRGLDAATDQFLGDLTEINRRVDRAERQISSGRRINNPSDAPDEVAHLLEVRTDLSAVEQIHSNLGRVRTEVDTAEETLRYAVTALDRVTVLGTQGATDIITGQGRTVLSGEVEGLLSQLVSMANTQVEGRYIFSGDTDQTSPYSVDLSTDDPVSAYGGSTSTRLVMHPSGTRFAIARTADGIFDSSNPADNVFDSVNALRVALRDDDVPAVRMALANVRTAAVHLNNQLAWYGGVQNQVGEATDFASRQETRLRTRISEIQDADITQAILDLQQGRFVQEAALNAQARKPRSSLFDYLG